MNPKIRLPRCIFPGAGIFLLVSALAFAAAEPDAEKKADWRQELQSLKETRDFEEASNLLNGVLQREPANFEVRCEVAVVAALSEEEESALEVLKKLKPAEVSTDAAACRAWGEAVAHSLEFFVDARTRVELGAQASAALRQAVRLAPTSGDTWLALLDNLRLCDPAAIPATAELAFRQLPADAAFRVKLETFPALQRERYETDPVVNAAMAAAADREVVVELCRAGLAPIEFPLSADDGSLPKLPTAVKPAPPPPPAEAAALLAALPPLEQDAELKGRIAKISTALAKHRPYLDAYIARAQANERLADAIAGWVELPAPKPAAAQEQPTATAPTPLVAEASGDAQPFITAAIADYTRALLLAPDRFDLQLARAHLLAIVSDAKAGYTAALELATDAGSRADLTLRLRDTAADDAEEVFRANAPAALRVRWLALRTLPPRRELLRDFAVLYTQMLADTSLAKFTPDDSVAAAAERSAAKDSLLAQAEEALYCAGWPSANDGRFARAWRFASRSLATVPTARALRALALASYGMDAPHASRAYASQEAQRADKAGEDCKFGPNPEIYVSPATFMAAAVALDPADKLAPGWQDFFSLMTDDAAGDPDFRFEEVMLGTALEYGLPNPRQFFARLREELALADQGKPNVVAYPLTAVLQASLADTFHGKRYTAERLEADLFAGRSHDALKLVTLVDELVRLDPYDGSPSPTDWRKHIDLQFAGELADANATRAVARIRELAAAGNHDPDPESDKVLAAAVELDPQCTRIALARALDRQRTGDEEGMLTVIRDALASRPAPAAAAELLDLRAPVQLRNKAFAAWLIDRATAATLRGEDVAAVEKDWLARTDEQGKDADTRLTQALESEAGPRRKVLDFLGCAVIAERRTACVERGKLKWNGDWSNEQELRVAAVDWAQAGQYDRALAGLDFVLKRSSQPVLVTQTYENLAYTRVQMAMRAAERYSRWGLPYDYDRRLARELSAAVQAALAACDRAEQAGKPSAWVEGQRGDVLRRVGRFAEAAAAAKRAIALDPKKSDHAFDLGIALLMDQHYGEAREAFQRYLAALPPDSPDRAAAEGNLKHIEGVLGKNPDFDHAGDFQPQPLDLVGPGEARLSGVKLTVGVSTSFSGLLHENAHTADFSSLALVRRKGAIQDYSMAEQKLHPWAAYLNGRQIGEAVPDITSDLRISADGRRLAYEADFRGEGSAVVVDGQRGPLHDGMVSLAGGFSPDGQHFAYTVYNSDGTVSRTSVYVDGKPGTEMKTIHDLRWRDNQLVYLAVQSDDKPVLMEGDHATALAHPGRDLTVSPDGRRLAYVEGADSDHGRVVVDGQSQGDFGKVSALAFSPDSKHVTWKAETAGLWRIYMDGRDLGVPAGSGDSDLRIVFSSGGAHWIAYGACDPAKKTKAAVLDGKPVELNFSDTGWLRSLSPDGTRWAAVDTRDKKAVIIVDGKEVATCEPFDSGINLSGQFSCVVFSPDSKHVAWIDRPDGESAIVAIDGVRGPAYTKIRSLSFCANRAVYLASRKRDGGAEYYFCVDFGGYLLPTSDMSTTDTVVESAPGVIRFIGDFRGEGVRLFDSAALISRVRVDIDVTKAPQVPSPAELGAAEQEKRAAQTRGRRDAAVAAKAAQEAGQELTPDARAKADAALQLARAAVKKSDLAAVEQQVSAAIAAAPRYAPALVLRASLKATKNDAAGARADLDTAVAADPKSAEALGSRALLRQSSGDNPGAESDAAAAIALDPTAKEARFARAKIKLASRDIGGAIDEIDAVLKGAEKPAEAYVARAQLEAAAGKRDDAVKDVQAAAVADPDNAQLRIGLADMLLKLGDVEAARAQLQAAEKLGDTRAATFLSRSPFTAAPPKSAPR